MRLLATSPRLPAGLLSWTGWQTVRSAPVYAADAASSLATALAVAGVHVGVLSDPDPAVTAAALRGLAVDGGVVWLVGTGGDAPLVRALGACTMAEPGRLEVEAVHGSWDPPGARLLDVVAVMDRLRSPGGCPWDAEQTHDSLRRYLLEETYEAYDALVDGDLEALREELGDVLLQVVFHARLAEEAAPGWSIDDVATDLVDKLVRRHPHVFAADSAERDMDASGTGGAAGVAVKWEQIKRAEKGRTSVTDGVARSQPALALAQALLRRAARNDLPLPAAGVAASSASLGEQLLATVVAAEAAGLDAEAELRTAADRYADALRATEHADPPPPS